MKQKEIEKRELLEQQQKILEAGAQRADKRTGSFNFLTWSFFIAPLIAGEEFLASTIKSAAAEEEAGKTAQATATAHTANDYSPASDPVRTTIAAETERAPTGSAATFAVKPSHSEPVPAAPGTTSGGGAGSDDGDSSHHDAHAIHGSSVNSLASSHLGAQLLGDSTNELVQSNVLGHFSAPTVGSGPLL